MEVNPATGKLADPSILVNVPKLATAYYALRPDPSDPRQRVVSGTSGRRGSAFDCAFPEWRILAIEQAICGYRRLQNVDGRPFLGIDTHALSEPALASALEALAADSVELMLSEATAYTPAAAVSHAIVRYNEGMKTGLADGFVAAYERMEAPATAKQKAAIERLSPSDIRVSELAGEEVQQILTAALGDGNPIAGMKAARPPGTEDIYKIYAKSFSGPSVSIASKNKPRPSFPRRSHRAPQQRSAIEPQ